MKLFLTYSYITTNSQTIKTKAMILAWPWWKIIEQAELQVDGWKWGCMLPGCRTRLLQEAAAQLQRFARYSSLTALAWWEVLLSLQKLSCRREEVSMEKGILLSLTTQCLRFRFHFIDFWWLMDGKAWSSNSGTKGDSRSHLNSQLRYWFLEWHWTGHVTASCSMSP